MSDRIPFYAGCHVINAAAADSGRVEFNLQRAPETETPIEQSRRVGVQVDLVRYVAAREMCGYVRRAKADPR
ncbi:MAG: hypothetical protein M3P18_21805 [Actinomycetota bacterium]|nr:hypothetical protein [Actinomycetota bacterium]